jgi:hypothetical protein
MLTLRGAAAPPSQSIQTFVPRRRFPRFGLSEEETMRPATERATPLPPAAPLNRLVRTARASLERGRFSWFWVVESCPYCGDAHDHYAGPIDGDPHMYAGHAVAARCSRTDRRRIAHQTQTPSLWYVIEPVAPSRNN